MRKRLIRFQPHHRNDIVQHHVKELNPQQRQPAKRLPKPIHEQKKFPLIPPSKGRFILSGGGFFVQKPFPHLDLGQIKGLHTFPYNLQKGELQNIFL
jgi:hypothetical protein